MRPAVAFALVLGLAACDRAPAKQSAIPAPGEPFDSAACPQVLAEYEPHPANRGPDEELYRWVMRPIQKTTASTDERTVFEVHDRASGRLLTTLTLVHTWSNGFSRPYVLSQDTPDPVLESLVVYLNRDLSYDTGDGAAYAILFPDLRFNQYYLHKRYEKVGGLVFHTPEKVFPLLPEMWVLKACGPAQPVNAPATPAPDAR
jgi:hypothetical protein